MTARSSSVGSMPLSANLTSKRKMLGELVEYSCPLGRGTQSVTRQVSGVGLVAVAAGGGDSAPALALPPAAPSSVFMGFVAVVMSRAWG